MKKILLSLAVLVPFMAVAQDNVAPRLVQLKVSDVESKGEVLKTNRGREIETFIVGVNLKANFPNACTKFVGQSTSKIGHVTLVGAQNPLISACKALAVAPVDTTITVSIDHNKMLPVASDVVVKLVKIGDAFYQVKLDTGNNSVTVKAVGKKRD